MRIQSRTGFIFVLAIVMAAALSAAALSMLLMPGQPNVTAISNPGELPDPYDPVPERVFAQPEVIQIETGLPPIEKDPPDYPNLDSNLSRLAQVAVDAPRPASLDGQGSGQAAEPVLVTFYIDPSHTADVHEYLEKNGVFVRNVGDDYIEAHVPPALLRAASERPGVLRVDTVVRLPPDQTRLNLVSQGVALHGAAAWHEAGYRGDNVRVGVIDSGFEGFSRLQGTKLPGSVTARCYFAGPRAPSSRLEHCEVDSEHGTAVAETLLDVAPAVDLYIANPHTRADLRNAVDWMAAQGVKVINHSLGYSPDGPGDGTSPFSNSPLRTVDAAVAASITWITSGGNSGLTTWYGTYTDPDGVGAHHFTSTDLGNTFNVAAGDEVTAYIRWEDAWGGADCDLDLELYKNALDADGHYTLVSWDRRRQDGSRGSIPLAIVGFDGEATASDAGQYFLAIRKDACAEEPAWIQLIAYIGGRLEHSSPALHISNPAEGRNPGMLAVGATHYWNTRGIAPYSSRGPTLDGRTKPDITGVACARSTVSPVFFLGDGTPCWFAGTSQSAPHVAGLAALAQQRFPGYRPTQLTRYLRQQAAERGAAGPDNTWGHGLATLPDPLVLSVTPVPSPTPVPSLTPATAQKVAPPTANIAVRDGSSSGEVIVSWDAVPEATYYRIGSVNMKTDYPLATASASGEWRSAFLYSDVNAINFTVENGRVEYTIRRLEPGVPHAFTVHTTGDATYDLTYGGQFRWPIAPGYWAYHTVQ